MPAAEDALYRPPPIAAPARVERRGPRRCWLCPNCAAMLGEVVGQRVVIAVDRGRRLTMPVRNEPEQSCPKCGAASVLRGAA